MVVMDRYISFSDEFDRRRQEQAAIIIQSIIRRFLAVRLLERMKVERRERAAVIIQGQVRKFLAQRYANQLRYEREILDQLRQKHAAIVIQRFYRQQRQKKYEHAAIVLQSHIRKFLAMQLVKRMKQHSRSGSQAEREQFRLDEERAAIVLQSHIRKFLAIRRVEHIRARRESLQQIRERHAATVIQRFYRSHRHQRFERAAIVLQSHVRKFLAVRRYQRIKATQSNRTTPFSNYTEEEHRMDVDPPKENRLGGRENIASMCDEKLNAVCDRLLSETARAARDLDNEGPLGERASSPKKYDEYTAALKIQKTWRGFHARRRHSDILEKLSQTRLSLQNSLDNHDENFPVHQLVDIYMPLFYSTSLRKRQNAASFMNLATDSSHKLTEEFLDRDGIPAILAASGTDRKSADDARLQKELADLLLKCLECTSCADRYTSLHVGALLEMLVRNVTTHRAHAEIMAPTCASILRLSHHADAPSKLKDLQFAYHVSQWRKNEPDAQMVGSALRNADETLRLINALPE